MSNKSRQLDRPTPETNSAFKFWPCEQMELVDAEVARRLERERDEARSLAQQMSESNQVLMADVMFYRNAWEQLKDAAK